MSDEFIVISIPASATVQQLVPGDPEAFENLAVKLSGYAGAFSDAASKVSGLDTSGWSGEAAEAFRSTVTNLSKGLRDANSHFADAVSAVRAYKEALLDAQSIAKDVIDNDAAEARQASRKHADDVDAYNAAVKGGYASAAHPGTDPGKALMEAAAGRLNKARAALSEAQATAQSKLDAAAKAAPDRPSDLSQVVKGAKEGFTGLASTAWKSSPYYAMVDPVGFIDNQAATLDSLVFGVRDPLEFGKAAVDWDTWQSDPARALGHLLPDIALFLATKGVSNYASRAGKAAEEVSAARKAEDAARKGVEAQPKPTPEGKRPLCNDPVDVATGEMVQTQTDVDLPGVLPLVLQRTHLSSYSVGRWFGRSWASTLDERLELDEEGAVYTAPDAMLLAYPVPTQGTPAFPTKGPRWPLLWDGTPGGALTITDPETGHTRHFAAPQQGVGATILPIQAITDRNGNRITFTYDGQGAPTEVAHSGGYRIAVETADRRVTRLRLLAADASPEDHGIPLLTYGYDGNGNLIEVVNSSGRPLRYTYDAQARITGWEDRNGTHFRYVYDEHGRCLRTVGPDGIRNGTFTYATDDCGNRTTTYTDSLGHTTTFHLNDAYQITRETDSLGNTTLSEWDAQDRLLSRTDPLGRTTRYTYDTDGNLAAITRPDGTAATAAYNDLRQPLTVTAPDGANWRHAYDARGNLTSTTDPTGATTTFTHDGHGHLTSVTNALDHTTRITTNPAGLPTTITDPLGATTRYSRNVFGLPTAIIDPLGSITRYGYTVEGKPSWRTAPDGSTERWNWDAEGNLTSHTNPAGHTARFEITHFDLTSARTEPDGARYTFTHDTELRLTQVTNPQGLTWTYTYDPAGRLVSETDFNNRALTYTHDEAGQLTSRTNGAGETITFARDPLGRLTEQRTDADALTTFAYDPVGRLTQATNHDTTLTRTYDAAGRLLTETTNGRTLANTYNSLGNRTTRITPTGTTSTWAYDPNGQPITLTTAAHTINFTYDQAGRETNRTLGPHLTLAQDWDDNHRLTAQTITTTAPPAAPTRLRDLLDDPKPQILQHRTYTYRPDGYLTSLTDTTTGTRHFTLDPLGRVTAVTATNWTETYAYDSAGNLTHATTPASPDCNGPRIADRGVIKSAGRIRYEYDNEGRVVLRQRTRLSRKPDTWRYAWDADDRLTTVTTPDGQIWRYLYDPLGRRTAKQRLAPDGDSVHEETRFTWDGPHLVEQTTNTLGNSEELTITWDRDGIRPLTQIERRTFADAPQHVIDQRFFAIVTDLIGTPTELVSTTGSIAWHLHTTLWGITTVDCDNTAYTPLRFPGQYFDPETQLHYNYFRHYDPAAAIYISSDPLGLEAGPNPRAYVPNPLGWLDYLGLLTCAQNARQLAQNMAREGRTLGPGQAAAHVVPSGGSARHWAPGARARALLQRYGININDAANGIPLGHPTPHNFTHRGPFINRVSQHLEQVVRDGIDQGLGARAIRSQLRQALRDIGRAVDGELAGGSPGPNAIWTR